MTAERFSEMSRDERLGLLSRTVLAEMAIDLKGPTSGPQVIRGIAQAFPDYFVDAVDVMNPSTRDFVDRALQLPPSVEA